MADFNKTVNHSFKKGICLLVFLSFYQFLCAWPKDTAQQPVRTLRLAIHVFQDDAGQGNFRQETEGQERFLYQLADWVNRRLASLDTLKPSMPSPYIADSRVRIRLDTIYYHRDTKAWDCSVEIDAPYMREQYVDGDALLSYLEKYQTLPVFIGANNPVTGGHSRNIGDRGYIAVRGYFESYIRDPHESSLDECGRNLVHELGHCLGLAHNFTGGPGGDQCDNCEDNGCPMEGTSNNIMDYWPSYGYALSKCQFDQIHFFLNGGKGNISEVVINDSCYRAKDSIYRIPAGEVLLVSDTVYWHQDVIVGDGGLLRVSGYLSMPGESKIEVEPGGRVEVDGGTIGNLCGDLWTGIRVSNPSGMKPAFVSVAGGGIIEHARTGFLAGSGVKSKIEDAQFRNCRESIVFLRGSSDTLSISNCNFRITTKLNHYEEGITPEYFIRSEGVAVLDVRGSSFVNEPGTYLFDADWMGTGISADGVSVLVENSEFRNLTSGVEFGSQFTDSRMEISGNRFVHNRYGVLTGSAGVQLISGNRFVLQRYNSGCTIGLLLWSPRRFAVTGNTFESVYGGGRMSGIVVNDPGNETAPVFNNKFSNLPAGIFMDGIPDLDSLLFQWAKEPGAADPPGLGPQFRFNQYDSVGLHLAVVSDSVHGTATVSAEAIIPEIPISAADWATGGYAWFADGLNMVAFNGWTSNPSRKPDHSLYWFMNYAGYSAQMPVLPEKTEYARLVAYLNKISSVQDIPDLFFGNEVHNALARVSEVPALVRSALLVPYWERLRAGDQAWLTEALASIAGRFSGEDLLLTDLGTRMAQNNLDTWRAYLPASHPDDSGAGPSPVTFRFELPDLTAFRFSRPILEPSAKPAFIVYPNPGHEYVLIRPVTGYSFGTGWQGSVTSAEGRHMESLSIKSWEDQKLNISTWPAGVFIIELFSGIEYLGSVKFVKTTYR